MNRSLSKKSSAPRKKQSWLALQTWSNSQRRLLLQTKPGRYSLADGEFDLDFHLFPTCHPSSCQLQADIVHRLTANYVAAEEGNVSRQALFASYMKVCDAYSVRGLNSASFGKVIRATFPAIKTRRLGVRGNSKYHCRLSSELLPSKIPDPWTFQYSA